MALRWLRRRGPDREGLIPALEDAAETAPLRLLVVADAAGATLQLNLLRPLAPLRRAGAMALLVLTEDSLAQAVSRLGASAAAAALRRRWQAFRPSAAFVSRYGGPLAAELLEIAAASQTPLVFHLDDNLFEVPAELGRAKFVRYGDPQRQLAMRSLLEHADLAYLSTELLHRQLAERGPIGGRVVTGTIASAGTPLAPPAPRPAGSGKRFGYMATASHGADLALALPGIHAALDRDPQLRFELFGTIAQPASLSKYGDRVRRVPPVADYDKFLLCLRDLAWDLGLAPLCGTRFNDAKTNTKWVEYAAAGIPVLASDHALYRGCCADGAGVLVPDAGWEAAILRVLDDAALRREMRTRAWRRLEEEYAPARLGGQLLEVLETAGASLPETARSLVGSA